MTIRKLAGQTAIYGISSIVGRAFYFLLTPIYTALFSTGEYGVLTGMFAMMGFSLVLFTYRMEMAYFRFGAEAPEKSFDTGFTSLVFSTVFLGGLLFLFRDSAAELLGYPGEGRLIGMCAGIIAFDALSEIPFARLRLEGRPVRFAVIRLTGIGINLGLNLFFLIFSPWAIEQQSMAFFHPVIEMLYDPAYGICYIFLSNLLASGFTLILLLGTIRSIHFQIDLKLWKEMLGYALPLVLVGFSFVVNELLDRQLLPLLGKGTLAENQSQLGIYGANYKLAMILSLFTQAFRYGAEPFFFRERHKKDARETYALLARYFFIIGLSGFLGIMLFIDIFRYFIDEAYWGGLHVVPVLLLGNLMLGVYYNLTVWYKLKDMTMWGAYISLGGALITIILNIWWIPQYGFTGSAWATLICYSSMTVACFFLGRHYYPIPYDVGRFFLYLIIALGIWKFSSGYVLENTWTEGMKRIICLLGFGGMTFLLERRQLKKILS